MANIIWRVIWLLLLSSCANPIHVSNRQFENAMDGYVGKPFSMYPFTAEQLVKETDSYWEYEEFVSKDTKGTKCSWLVRVSKNSNTIESWRYASTPCSSDD